MTEQGGMASNWKRASLAITEFLCCEGGEALKQVAQKSHEWPIPGSIQGQAGWSSGQPGLVEGALSQPTAGGWN